MPPDDRTAGLADVQTAGCTFTGNRTFAPVPVGMVGCKDTTGFAAVGFGSLILAPAAENVLFSS